MSMGDMWWKRQLEGANFLLMVIACELGAAVVLLGLIAWEVWP